MSKKFRVSMQLNFKEDHQVKLYMEVAFFNNYDNIASIVVS
jgi:hypothetical protein